MKKESGSCLIVLIIGIGIVACLVGFCMIVRNKVSNGVKESSVRTYTTILRDAEMNQTADSVTINVGSKFGTWRLNTDVVRSALQKPSAHDMYKMVKEHDGGCFVASVMGVEYPVIMSLKNVPMDECK